MGELTEKGDPGKKPHHEADSESPGQHASKLEDRGGGSRRNFWEHRLFVNQLSEGNQEASCTSNFTRRPDLLSLKKGGWRKLENEK